MLNKEAKAIERYLWLMLLLAVFAAGGYWLGEMRGESVGHSLCGGYRAPGKTVLTPAPHP